MSRCTCPLAGYCDRHKVNKTEHWHNLCRTNHSYRSAWDEGRGPGQTPEPNQCKIARQKRRLEKLARQKRLIAWLAWFRAPEDQGVGDTVERLLAKVGGRQIKQMIESLGGKCGCSNRQKWLNQRFPYPPASQ